MNVPFRLRRLDAALSATGLLLPVRDTAVVLEVVAAIGEPLPEIYAIPDGFLFRRSEPIAAHPPETLRLRERAPHLFLPIDAELSPGLLDDEAHALTREQGLIFLPGECVLGYDRTERISLADLVALPVVRRDTWRGLPEGSRLVERIRVVLDERPRPTVEMILQEAAGDVGSEETRPPEAPTTTQAVTGNVQAGLGRFFVWLGGLFRWRWLAQQGANLLDRAMQNNPRSAEDILGRQEAALRDLLRQFREGNRDEALRRALPIGGSPHRGSTVADSADLPTHNLRFALGELLGSGGGGAARMWLTPDQLAAQLAEEYRRAAREAAAAGDYRRAAFIHAKLLGDFRLAADLLARGGYHQEAATLYLERVGDELAAAACFEAAGDIDQAVRLFHKNAAHVEAGDVLRRAGDEDAALEEYRRAAEWLVEKGRMHQAGDLFHDHVHRPDLAADYYEAGWRQRSPASATHCVLRLLDLRAATNDRAALLALAREAADYYERSGAESEAVQVFNRLVRLGEQTLPAEQREELRDRALIGLAGRLRQHAAADRKPGGTVATLLGREGVWSAGVVADAEVALRGEIRKQPGPTPTPARTGFTIVSLGHQGVTAVAGTASGEALFVGFEDGHIVRFRPATAMVQEIERPVHDAPIDSLGSDPSGLRLLVLAGKRLESHGQKISGRLAMEHWREVVEQEDGIGWLSHLIGYEGDWIAVLWGPERGDYCCENLEATPWDIGTAGPTTAAVLVPDPGRRPLVLRFSFDQVEGFHLLAGPSEPIAIEHGARVPPPAGRVGPLDARTYPQEDGPPLIAVVGRDEAGHVWLIHLTWTGDRLASRSCWYTAKEGYLAECLLDREQVAAVRRDGVVWLRPEQQRLEPWANSPASLEDAVAVWPGWQGHEVIVVRSRGDVVRVPRPR